MLLRQWICERVLAVGFTKVNINRLAADCLMEDKAGKADRGPDGRGSWLLCRAAKYRF